MGFRRLLGFCARQILSRPGHSSIKFENIKKSYVKVAEARACVISHEILHFEFESKICSQDIMYEERRYVAQKIYVRGSVNRNPKFLSQTVT